MPDLCANASDARGPPWRPPRSSIRGDEYRLITHPVAVGSGLPMFKDLPTPLRLELVDVVSFGSANLRVYRSV